MCVCWTRFGSASKRDLDSRYGTARKASFQITRWRAQQQILSRALTAANSDQIRAFSIRYNMLQTISRLSAVQRNGISGYHLKSSMKENCIFLYFSHICPYNFRLNRNFLRLLPLKNLKFTGYSQKDIHLEYILLIFVEFSGIIYDLVMNFPRNFDEFFENFCNFFFFVLLQY